MTVRFREPPPRNRFGRPRRGAAPTTHKRAPAPRQPCCDRSLRTFKGRGIGPRTARYTPIPYNFELHDRET